MSFHVIGSMETKFSLLYYHDICCYQFGAWQNWASRETKPGQASYRWWILSCNGCCAWFCHWLFLSLKLCQSLFWAWVAREKSLATPMFQVLLSGCATQSGMQEGGWKQSTCLKIVTKAYLSLRGVNAHWMCIFGHLFLPDCKCKWSQFFFSINLIWMPSIYLRIFNHQQNLAASSNSPKISNFGSCL